MTASFDSYLKWYLAVRGESPELLPFFEEGEDGAVLTLARELKATLLPRLMEATLKATRFSPDELVSADITPLVDTGGVGLLQLPEDYLKLYSLKMPDWREPLTALEEPGSLRAQLGANAPQWMVCSDNPMVLESVTPSGRMLRVFGSDALDLPARLVYVPLPRFDGTTITAAREAMWDLTPGPCDLSPGPSPPGEGSKEGVPY